MATKTKSLKSATRGPKLEGSAQLGSKKCASRASEYEMRILDGSWEMFQFEPDEFSVSLLAMTKPEWVPSEIFFEVCDSLRGFTENMALIIADDVIDCWSGLGLHYTGFQHIDDLLGHLYSKILACAFRTGIKLEYHYYISTVYEY